MGTGASGSLGDSGPPSGSGAKGYQEMLRTTLFAMALGAVSLVAVVRAGEFGALQKDQSASCRQRGAPCVAPRCTCGKPLPCEERPEQPFGGPNEPPKEPYGGPAQPYGAFVAPPQSGPVRGESGGFGLEGPSVTFPRATLSLPTLHFGSFFRTRSNAKMMLDSAEAPFAPGLAFGAGVANASGFGTTPAGTAGYGAPAPDRQLLDELYRRLRNKDGFGAPSPDQEECQAKLQEMEQRNKDLQERLNGLEECLHRYLQDQPNQTEPPSSVQRSAYWGLHQQPRFLRPQGEVIQSLPPVTQESPLPTSAKTANGPPHRDCESQAIRVLQRDDVRRLPPSVELR